MGGIGWKGKGESDMDIQSFIYGFLITLGIAIIVFNNTNRRKKND